MNWAEKRAQAKLIAKNATKVRKAFKASINGDAIAQSWAETHPAGGSVSPQTARDWARTHAITNKKPMQNALAGIYADGYVFGERIAKARLAGLKKDAKTEPITVSVVDWSTWKPGMPSAAALVKPRGGLRSLLESRKITIADEVINTRLDRIGTALSTALKKGFGADETAEMIDAVIDDPEAAMVIARTETARAVSIATRDEYETNNVQQVEWIFGEEGVCDICSENADASPIGIGDTFPSGDAEPPAHPNCMCTLVPYYEPLEDLPEVSDEPIFIEDVELSVNSDLNKYDDDQPRDENGRWTDTGAGGGGGNSDGGSAGSSNIGQEAQQRANAGKEIDVKDFISGERSYEGDRNKMGEIIHQQGWDKASLVANPEEYDKLKASGDYVEVFRGGPEGLTEGLTSGSPWIGDGNAGPGTYVTTDVSRAESFAALSDLKSQGREVVTMLAPKSMMDKAPNISQVPKNPLPSKWNGKERAEYVGVAASGIGAYQSTAESSAKGDYVIYNTSALIIRGK